jgi:hypothetical protein
MKTLFHICRNSLVDSILKNGTRDGEFYLTSDPKELLDIMALPEVIDEPFVNILKVEVPEGYELYQDPELSEVDDIEDFAMICNKSLPASCFSLEPYVLKKVARGPSTYYQKVDI